MNDQEIVIGDFRLDPSNACLWRGGEMINLSPKVFKVLSYLVRRAGQLVTRDELLGAVWPDTIVGEAALTVCVREIRKALGDRAGAPRYIETRHRHGYRLIAPTRKSTIDPEQATNNEAPPGLVGRAAELNQLLEQVGKYFAEGDLILLVEDPSSVEAEVRLDEEAALRVRAGQAAVLRPRTAPLEKLPARVRRTPPAAEPGETNSRITIDCTLDTSAPYLRPGMSGYARIETGRRTLGAILLDRLFRALRTEHWW